MKALLLTLGHNSSAILVEDGKIVWGYETERVTGLKSDSRFPRPVLDKYLTSRPDVAYVTHWAPDGLLASMDAKYWDPSYLEGVPIRTLDVMQNRSHHDTHMAAARCYAGKNFPIDRTYGFVIDGFGTLGEHFSVYDLTHGQRLIERVHGYDTSLGLWYQYATAFMGMKMHEDEYKLLGYEVHVDPLTCRKLDDHAEVEAMHWLKRMAKSVYGSKYDPMYDLKALEHVKTRVFNHLSELCKAFDIEDPSTETARPIIAYYVQRVLEQVVRAKVDQYRPRNVILSGGCFYNVKLGLNVMQMVDGQTCVYPLAGDQGNAIGLYYMDYLNFEPDWSLCWGRRELKDVGQVPNLHVCADEVQALDVVKRRLADHGHVNLVRGAMEFGPRALCNTSTLALPTAGSVRTINEANDRNTVMPMAPVMTRSMWKTLYEDTARVWRSYMHMIIAMEYQEHPLPEIAGVTHEYWHPYHHHTGRPQVVGESDHFMNNLLNHFGGPLINTSFNFHGMPIALGMESVIKNHMMQYQRQKTFSTVVIRNDK